MDRPLHLAKDNDNNNNEEEVKPAVLPSPARARRQYLLERQLSQMRSFQLQGATDQQICDWFRIDKSTYYRWQRKIAAQDRVVLQKKHEETVLREVARVRDVFKTIEQHMGKIMRDKTAEATDRIEAAHLLGEIAATGVNMLTEGPITTVKGMPKSLKRRLTIIAEQEGYDELDIGVQKTGPPDG